jgi:hypothetical protein
MRVNALSRTHPVLRHGTLVELWVAMRIVPRFALAVCMSGGLLTSSVAVGARQAAPVPLAERARGAEVVVVGRVSSVSPVWQVNEFGDRLIVSVVRIAVSETLKGPASTTLDVEVEGGTIGGVTLHVSDETSFTPGERAVFYLKRNVRGAFAPHLRGEGLLKLDASNRVPGSSLTLAGIRRQVAAGSAR